MTFKLGITRDVLDSQGQPSFGTAALKVLDANPAIAWEYLPERITEVSPELASRYDGLYVNSPKVTQRSVGGPDCRLKIIARHGGEIWVESKLDKGTAFNFILPIQEQRANT